MLDVKLIDRGPKQNSKSIIVTKGKETFKYLPSEITEYGFENGKTYYSREIDLNGYKKDVFLERLATGKVSLFRCFVGKQEKFFLLRDSIFLELENNYESFKAIIGTCTSLSDAAKLASYHKGPLTKLVSLSNNCIEKPFPFKRIGILTGINQNTYKVTSAFSYEFLNDFDFQPISSFLIGAFVDLPIKMTYFSFIVNAYFTGNSTAINQRKTSSDIDVLINTQSLHLPIKLQYTLPTLKWRPFINIGGKFTHNFKNASTIYRSDIDGSVILINQPIKNKAISQNLIGFTAGVGLSYNLDFRKRIYLEISTSGSRGKSKDLSQKEMALLFGFSF